MSGRRAHGTGSIWVEKRVRGDVWVGQVRVGGKQYQRTLGKTRTSATRSGLTRTQAEKELRVVRERIEAEVAAEASRRPGSEVRLSRLAEIHFNELEQVEGRKIFTVADYRMILDGHLIPYFGDVRMDEVTTQDVEAFIQRQLTEGSRRRKGEGLKPSTVLNHVNVLGAIFRTAVRKGIVPTNPVTSAKKPRVGKDDEDLRFLSVEEVEALIRATPDTDLGRVDAAIYLTAAMTGLRRGEIIALRWRDVDWVAGKVRVRASRRRGLTTSPKTQTSKRAVPMSSRVAGALDRLFQRSRYQHEDDPVFCNPETGRHIDPDALTSRFKTSRDAAGLPPIRFHDLRHTFGTLMAASGVDILKIKHWMGHADVQTTMIYTHYAPAADESAMIDRAFEAGQSDLLTVTNNG